MFIKHWVVITFSTLPPTCVFFSPPSGANMTKQITENYNEA